MFNESKNMNYSPETKNDKFAEAASSFCELKKMRSDFEHFVKVPDVKIFPELLDEDSPSIFYVPESEQVIGSFKVAGPASFMLMNLRQIEKGVVAPSAGNHAQGVAYIARELGVPATIFMPESSPAIKQQAVKSLGGKVELIAGDIENSIKEAERYAEYNEISSVPPYDHPDVIAGNAMLFDHIPEEVNYIFTPVGGGGLVAGLSLAAALSHSNVEIIGIRPPSEENFANFRYKPKDSSKTIADGAAVEKIGNFPLEILRGTNATIRRISEDRLYEAMALQYEISKTLYNDNSGTMPEGAGALAFAGVLDSLYNRDEILSKKVAIIASGKNIDLTHQRHVLRSARALQNGLYSQARREFMI